MPARSTFTGLDTRVAVRTFAMFCLCAVVPILLSAYIADRLVSRKFRDMVQAELVQVSKSHGLAVFQRLNETDAMLNDLARLHLQGDLSLENLRDFGSQHFRIVEARVAASPPRGSAAQPAEPMMGSIAIVGTRRAPQVQLTVEKTLGSRSLTLAAVLNDRYLWDTSGADVQSRRICVHTEFGVLLRCQGELGGDEAAAGAIEAQWLLYLRPRYGAPGWTVSSTQSTDIALAGLQEFRRILPITTLIAVAVALLLSAIQIRRSHGPLALLVDAADRIGREQFDRRLAVRSRDEYGRLATAFNSMAESLEERRRALLHQAYYDELTGLPNRQLFKDRLQQELARAKRAGGEVALIYVDLDRFKHINDSLGHSAGDELVRGASARLATAVRDTDTLARLGGDEFVVIASDLQDLVPHVLAERLQDSLREPLVVRNVSCCMTASFGITVYPRDGDSEEELLRNADIAMYRAKAAGGGRAMYFEEVMNRDVRRRLILEQKLREAVRNEALYLMYQPKVSLVDGSIYGVEALSRWSDPELGVVPPSVFIPIAEETGIIDQLGLWALREACNTFQSWLRAGRDMGHISVNASMRQLRDRRFVHEVMSVLRDTGMRAGALEIEVTESMLADRPEEVAALLQELRAIGVRIAIDDFGTGYSSMAALAHLPIDVVKVDRSFVTDCATRGEAASLVQAVISMAHVLGKITVAEGVESHEQLTMLRRLGCDAIQGYLFAMPMLAPEIDKLPLQFSLAGTRTAANNAVADATHQIEHAANR